MKERKTFDQFIREGKLHPKGWGKRPKMPKQESALEAELAMQIAYAKLPDYEREFRFDDSRRWRFDFAWPALKVAAECEGGLWSGGRHTRPKGFEADAEKYNAAALLSWIVLRFTGAQIKSGYALDTLSRAIKLRQPDAGANAAGDEQTNLS